jgi:uncharacterized protein YceK
MKIPSTLRILLVLAVAATTSGCASLMSSAGAGVGRSLTAGVVNADDPATVAAGLPAYLLLIDGFIDGDPANPQLLLSGAKLYGAYAGSFVDDPARRTRLALKADAYARRAVCARDRTLCAGLDAPFDQFEKTIAAAGADDIELMHAAAVARAGVLQADPSDFVRLADLPRVELLLARVHALDPAYDGASASMYLGVLNCLRPPSLGGKPDEGVRHFAEALERSGGRNQMARVLDAEYCARLTFDQERHDALLAAVLAADPVAPGLTLANTLARERARALLESGKDYF